MNTHITERSMEEDRPTESLVNKEDWVKESAKSYRILNTNSSKRQSKHKKSGAGNKFKESVKPEHTLSNKMSFPFFSSAAGKGIGVPTYSHESKSSHLESSNISGQSQECYIPGGGSQQQSVDFQYQKNRALSKSSLNYQIANGIEDDKSFSALGLESNKNDTFIFDDSKDKSNRASTQKELEENLKKKWTGGTNYYNIKDK